MYSFEVKVDVDGWLGRFPTNLQQRHRDDSPFPCGADRFCSGAASSAGY